MHAATSPSARCRCAGSPFGLSAISALVLAACASQSGAVAVIAEPTEPLKVRPAGLSIDPELALPKAVPSARADGNLAVLAAPVDPEPARRVVVAFFRAVTAESLSDLGALFEPSATTTTSARRPESALSAFRRRFNRLDYTKGGETPYLPAELRVETARDVEEAGDASSLPLVPRGNQVLVRAPISSLVASRLFGPEVVFLLVPSESGYKIKQLYEDFRIP